MVIIGKHPNEDYRAEENDSDLGELLCLSRLATKPGVAGPTTIPAARYPTIGDSPIL